MDIREINEKYSEITKLVYDLINTLYDNKVFIKDNDSVIYELTEELDEEGDSCYITVLDGDGESFDAIVKKIYKNGNIAVYVYDLGEDWDIDLSDAYNLGDKISLLNLIFDNV